MASLFPKNVFSTIGGVNIVLKKDNTFRLRVTRFKLRFNTNIHYIAKHPITTEQEIRRLCQENNMSRHQIAESEHGKQEHISAHPFREL